MVATAERAKPIVGPEPHTDEWHAWRSSGIGASEAAAACGLSPYETPLHIYGRKTGMLPPIEDNDAMRLGRLLEPVVIEEFTRRTGNEVDQAPCPVMRHGDHPFILATPDAILAGGDLLEAKTTTWRIAKQLGEEGTDFIPEHWLCQAQQQIAVTGADRCHLAALIDGRTLRTFIVERNDNLIALLVSAEQELWERIVNKDPPEPNFEHARTAELIREMYGLVEGKTIVLGDGVAGLWIRQKELGERISELEKEREGLRAMVLHEMADASIAGFSGHEFELARSQVNRKEYTVAANSYITLRERKPAKSKGKK